MTLALSSDNNPSLATANVKILKRWLGAFVCLMCSMLAIDGQAKELPVYGKLGGDFTLTSHTGESVSLSQFKGKVVLVNFGYTSCPDICPMVLARLTQLERLLGEQAEQMQVLFISFDPERDSQQQLNSYLQYFSPNFIGLTGSDGELAAVAKQFGAIYVKQESDSASGPLFSHSDFIYLLDKEGKVRGLFSNQDTIQTISEKINLVLD